MDIVNLNKKTYLKIAIIVVFAIVEGFLVFAESSMAPLLAIGLMLLGLVWDKNITVAGFICSSVLDVNMGTMGNLVSLAVVGAIVGMDLINKKGNKTFNFFFNLTLLFFVSALFSYLFGIESKVLTLVLFLFRLLFALYVAKSVCTENDDIIVFSLIAVAVSMFLLVWLNMDTVGVFAYQENKKDLSTALAFPVYLIAWAVINGKVKGFFKIVLAIITMLLFFTTIVYTYSRGVLLALLVSVATLVIIANRKHRFGLVILFAVVAAVIYYTQIIQIDAEKMFGHLEGGNGRTEIWLNFYKTMKSQGLTRVLFGCGPNGLKTLTLGSTYAHSAILDYFFSFGVFGLIYILVVIGKTIISLFKIKNNLYFGLMVLTIFMFFPHGTYNDLLFLVLLGMCIGGACKPITIPVNDNK